MNHGLAAHGLALSRHYGGRIDNGLLLHLLNSWLGHYFCLVVKIGLIINIISGHNIDL